MHSVNKSNNSTSQSNDQILEQRKQEIGNILCSSINSSQPIKLDMSKKGLKSFDEIYQIIYDHAKKNPKTKYDFSKLNIKELDASSNQMRHFFNEANFDSKSVFKKNQKALKLSSITHVNILNNLQLNSIQESILQIQYLIPNIKSLEISLSEEEDVSFIILNMPQLEELNKIKVDRSQSSEQKGDVKQLENEKIKKQPFEMKELEEIKEDDFFKDNFQRDDSHSEFITSPAKIDFDQLNTLNLRKQDIQQHLNVDMISEIETTLRINQKSIQEQFDDNYIDQSEISSGNNVKRKKKTERINKSQGRALSNLKQSILKENQVQNLNQSPNKKIKNSNATPQKKDIDDNHKQDNNLDLIEKKEKSPLPKKYFQDENIIESVFNQNIEFASLNFENNYIKKSNSPQKIQNAQRPTQTQIIKCKNLNIQDEPITVEQIKYQLSNSSREADQNEQFKMNFLNLNKDLKGVSDISMQLQSQMLQSPDQHLIKVSMIFQMNIN